MEDVCPGVGQAELASEVHAEATEHARDGRLVARREQDGRSARNAASSASERNFAIGERTSPLSSATMYARPRAPHSFATSSRRASSAREKARGATMKRTHGTLANTPNSEPRVTSVASWISIP
jgi:hypothetical protein